ncbi:glycosyltransferase family 87 protein [Corynebacterium sp.]|uniref:glycosyltransferase family 87 protein n=1 Tax=Corynebacterium sp. TaxID=1720 RepID=UPI0026DC2830|nr:glycosyltransferase family 87 protein [Corynebacterium sp.]MDO5031728.1 glycosyltransferase family 87 protein [Corynebacterium sp.]
MTQTKHSLVLRSAAWPAAVILVFHRVAVLALNGTITDDFSTVYHALRRFIEGGQVYEQAYDSVDPLYLYTPGATLALSPIGLLPFEVARTLFIVFDAAAIIAALALLTRLCGHSLRGTLFPTSIALAFATESVTNTLAFTNINGFLLVAMAGFLYWLQSRPWASGLCIGLAILIKPQFAPLLFLPLIKRSWLNIAVGVGLPVAVNLVAWAVAPGARGYAEKLLPYLSTTRDFANASWDGARAYFGMPGALYYPVWILFALLAAFAILGLVRWHESEPVFWALSTSGVIMAGIFFLSSLGQQYYSMWLFPMMFTVVCSRSIFHTWGAWLAAFLFLAPLEWTSVHMPTAAHWMSVFTTTIGWGLLLVVSAASVAGWWAASPRKAQGATLPA